MLKNSKTIISRSISKLTGLFSLNTLKNLSYMSLFQVLNLVVPFFTYPYLLKILGFETFGKVIYAQVLVSFCLLLVNFGFNISGAKEASIYRFDKNKIAEIFSSILFIKSFLSVVSICFLLIYLYIFIDDSEFILLVVISIWPVIYDIIFPIWYFQGIDRLKYVSFVNLLMKLCFLVLTFIFITEKQDFLLIPIFNLIASLLAGFYSLYIIIVKHRIKLYVPKFEIVLHQFKLSLPIFLSNISTRLYSLSNKFIAGTFFGMSDLTIMDLAEKLLLAFKIPQSVLSVSVFSKVTREKNLSYILNLLKFSFSANFFLAVFLIYISDDILLYFDDSITSKESNILRIFLLSLPLTAASGILGTQFFIAFNHTKIYTYSVWFSLSFYICIILVYYFFLEFSIFNLAVALIITELFNLFFLSFYFYRYKFKYYE